MAQKGRRKEVPRWACKVCILRCLAGFCRDVQPLKKTNHATSSNKELCLGRYVCVLMWQWDGRHARLPHLRPDLVDIRASIWERRVKPRRGHGTVLQEMPLVLARPCFFPSHSVLTYIISRMPQSPPPPQEIGPWLQFPIVHSAHGNPVGGQVEEHNWADNDMCGL